jgi:heat shock protein HslJ
LKQLSAAVIALTGILAVACTTTAIFPAGLFSPDHGVLCDRMRETCFDRFGPSIGLTAKFLGQGAADALTATLRKSPPESISGTDFSPGANIACRRETGPCRNGGIVDETLTAVLYDPRPAGTGGTKMSTVTGIDWRWIVSRYNNGSETRPAEPALYLLRLEPDGSLRVRVDCNRAGGRYRLDGNTLAIDVLFSTRAACAPESLASEFQRDLGAAAIYFVKQGRLYLDLRNDTGTMEFRRE